MDTKTPPPIQDHLFQIARKPRKKQVTDKKKQPHEVDTNILDENNNIKPLYMKILAEYQPKDPSHDIRHIRHVLVNATRIYRSLLNEGINIDFQLVQLGALLHDLKDRKYIDKDDAKETTIKKINSAIKALCRQVGFTKIERLMELIDNVSFNKQMNRPEPWDTKNLMSNFPELAVVRDADRIDASGSRGVFRAVAFNAIHNLSPENMIEQFNDKLLHLHEHAYTNYGKKILRQRTNIMRVFYTGFVQEKDSLEEPSYA